MDIYCAQGSNTLYVAFLHCVATADVSSPLCREWAAVSGSRDLVRTHVWIGS